MMFALVWCPSTWLELWSCEHQFPKFAWNQMQMREFIGCLCITPRSFTLNENFHNITLFPPQPNRSHAYCNASQCVWIVGSDEWKFLSANCTLLVLPILSHNTKNSFRWRINNASLNSPQRTQPIVKFASYVIRLCRLRVHLHEMWKPSPIVVGTNLISLETWLCMCCAFVVWFNR